MNIQRVYFVQEFFVLLKIKVFVTLHFPKSLIL